MKETIAKLKKEGKNIIYLVIKQKYFDAIMQGRKVQETREVRPQYSRRFLQHDEEGYIIEDEHRNAIPVHYDYIHFATGYNKDRDEALVEVKDEYSVTLVHESTGEPIVIEYKGCEFWATEVVYNLGQIVETKINVRSRKK